MFKRKIVIRWDKICERKERKKSKKLLLTTSGVGIMMVYTYLVNIIFV